MITLPPKVKCPEPGCNGEGYIDHDEGRKRCPRCNGDGEIYLFDDLADAVREAELKIKLSGPTPQGKWYAIFKYENKGCHAMNPTAALAAAITAHNLKEEK